jgi:hypothetical protein
MVGVLPQYKYINKIISSDTPSGSQSEQIIRSNTPSGSQSEQDNTPLRVGEPQYKSPFRAGGIPQYKLLSSLLLPPILMTQIYINLIQQLLHLLKKTTNLTKDNYSLPILTIGANNYHPCLNP